MKLRLFGCFLSLIFAMPAMAFVSEPELDPNPAMAGQVVNLLIQTGICNAILGGENPTITVSDNQVEVVIDGARGTDSWWNGADLSLCR